MYFWKVNQKITTDDVRFLLNNNIENYYVRFFDVGWDNASGAIPKGLLNEKSRDLKQKSKFKILSNSIQGKKDMSVIPVVYIENVVFKNIKGNKIIDLAEKIHSKIEEINKIEFSNNPINEIQIDCDWSGRTKENYFFFLKSLKKVSKEKTMSVTIRLHQIKYPQETGIPPVKKGTLMYYNMGEIKNISEPNSILNNKIGRQYINTKTKYPLELNIALPVYSWSAWFDEGGFKGLLYSISSKNISDLEFLRAKNDNYYICEKDTVFLGNYLRKGDVFRLEEQNVEDIEEAKEICSPLLKGKKKEIIIFSYSPENSKLINHEDFNSIYSFN